MLGCGDQGFVDKQLHKRRHPGINWVPKACLMMAAWLGQ
jgi:hypothetical protein